MSLDMLKEGFASVLSCVFRSPLAVTTWMHVKKEKHSLSNKFLLFTGEW
jgi:hypothetical protein